GFNLGPHEPDSSRTWMGDERGRRGYTRRSRRVEKRRAPSEDYGAESAGASGNADEGLAVRGPRGFEPQEVETRTTGNTRLVPHDGMAARRPVAISEERDAATLKVVHGHTGSAAVRECEAHGD